MLLDNLFSSIQSTGIFVIIISILILVHELGHFITAKKLGVVVEQFSLGFGPKLFRKVHKGTEYLVCLIPLGGYVKMAGDERSECTGAAGEFHSQPLRHKALIVLNGPIVNYFLAYICFVFVFALGYKDVPSKIQELVEGYPASNYGLAIGDEIVKIDSKEVYGWTELSNAISESKNKNISITYLRNGKQFSTLITPKIETINNIFGQRKEMKTIGIGPYSTEIGMLDPSGPALNAGMKKGDRILSVDSQKVDGWGKMQKLIANSTGEEIDIVFLRDGKKISQKIVPSVLIQKDKGGKKEFRKIGIVPSQEISTYKFGFYRCLVKAKNKLFEITALTYKAFYFMITGAMSPKEAVTGPIGIFYFIKSAAETGLSQVLFVLGLISASLAIFNLLPIIPLDGGHLFLFFIEKIRKKALPPKVEDAIIRTGFSLIILLALFVFYSDFIRFGWIDNIKNLF